MKLIFDLLKKFTRLSSQEDFTYCNHEGNVIHIWLTNLKKRTQDFNGGKIK